MENEDSFNEAPQKKGLIAWMDSNRFLAFFIILVIEVTILSLALWQTATRILDGHTYKLLNLSDLPDLPSRN
jgi:hypothetical protein